MLLLASSSAIVAANWPSIYMQNKNFPDGKEIRESIVVKIHSFLGEVRNKWNLSLGKETNLIIAVFMTDTRSGAFK